MEIEHCDRVIIRFKVIASNFGPTWRMNCECKCVVLKDSHLSC